MGMCTRNRRRSPEPHVASRVLLLLAAAGARAAASLHAAIGADVPELAAPRDLDVQRRPGSILGVSILAHPQAGTSAAARPGAERVPDEDSLPMSRA